MGDVKKQRQTAVEAVARRFSARWEKGSDPSNAYIMVAGNALLLASPPSNGAAVTKVTQPGLV